MAHTPNFKKNIGRLATDRYDFEAHLQGHNPGPDSDFVTDFRHKASQVDVDNPSLVFGNPTNVEQALEDVNNFILSLAGTGQGFITVGDGYDTWHAADGNINFDNTIPALDLLLNPLFNDIYNGNPLTAAFERIKRGGIVVIKAGTYIVKSTINVPPGIILLGEGYGTKIVNATSLDTTTLPPTPKLSPTPAPVFNILTDITRSINDAPVDPSLFMFSRATKIMNMVIADNFVENTVIGDVFYKVPQNITGNNPLIQQQTGSNLELYKTCLMGRVAFSSGTVVSEATRFAIQLDPTLAIGNGTMLKVNDCFIDGFSQPINYLSVGGVADYLEVTNNKIRSHGYLDGDGDSVSTNNIITMNDNNVKISDNDLFGNHAALDTILYINAVQGGAVNLQSRSKMIIADNTLTINRGGTGVITAAPYALNGSIVSFTSKAVLFADGNIFDESATNGFTVSVTADGNNQVRVSSTELDLANATVNVTATNLNNTVGGTQTDSITTLNHTVSGTQTDSIGTLDKTVTGTETDSIGTLNSTVTGTETRGANVLNVNTTGTETHTASVLNANTTGNIDLNSNSSAAELILDSTGNATLKATVEVFLEGTGSGGQVYSSGGTFFNTAAGAGFNGSVGFGGGIIFTNITIVTAATFAIDSDSNLLDYLVLVPAGAFATFPTYTVLNLPALSGIPEGRVIIFKDSANNAGVNPIKLHANGTDTFDDGNQNAILATNGGSWTIVAHSGKWYFI